MQEDIERLVGAFKALSDPTRLQILMILENRALAVNEIVDYFQLSQPTISRHLNALAHAGLIKGEKREQKKIYSLDANHLALLFEDFYAKFKSLKKA